MPTYQYRCEECEKTFKRTETISEHEVAEPNARNSEQEGLQRTWSCLCGDIKGELRLPQPLLP